VLATVDYGAERPLTVVTGAPNLSVGLHGQKVAFATVGARVVDGHSQTGQHMLVQPVTLRGVRSEGMLLSEKELGLSDNHEGILVLEDDAPVGAPLADYLGDVVVELDLTPNLARALSVIGVAREVAALCGQTFRTPELATSTDRSAPAGQFEVAIEAAELCPRYRATLVRGVRVGPSPLWMQRRLSMAGMRPINNIVDITNYVMLECGEPLHAFDFSLLRRRADGRAPRIVVRRARPGEVMRTLDGELRQLDEDTLLITDASGPIAIAGVMGGEDTEVGDSATDILLEAAAFDNIGIRRTSRKLKITSESGLRFGRGVHPHLVAPASARAVELMTLLAGGTAETIVDEYPRPPTRPTIELAASEAERILGVRLPVAQMADWLRRLEFEVEVSEAQASLIAKVPPHRLDVALPSDLIEEIARMYGYQRIPETIMADSLPPQRTNRALEFGELVRDCMVGTGLQEVVTYPLTEPGLDAAAWAEPAEARYSNLGLANPVSPDRSTLRCTLLPSLLTVLKANLRFAERVTLFELGHVFLPHDDGLPAEPRRLGAVMSGPRYQDWWAGQADADDMLGFYDLKGVLDTLLGRLHVAERSYLPDQHPSMHPARTAALRLNDRVVGHVGELHPAVARRWDLPDQPIAVAEIDLEALQSSVSDAPLYRPFSPYPPVREDVALVVEEGILAAEVMAVVRQSGGELLTEARVFDVYRGPPVPPGQKSLAVGLTFQAPDRTLTDEEVARARAQIVQALERALGAQLRA
jgi:phenylalanyl-tRNA synthetase beta chain